MPNILVRSSGTISNSCLNEGSLRAADVSWPGKREATGKGIGKRLTTYFISTCSRSPFLFPDIPLTIYIPLARTTNVHSPIIPNHVYGGTHENNTGKSGNPYLTSVVARGYRFPFAGNFPSPSGNNLLHPNRTRNISVPNPPLSTLLVAGAGLRQRGLAVRSVGNSRHVLSPATLTIGPFSKTESHLYLPAQLIFDGLPRSMLALPTARSGPLATPMASDRIRDGPPPCEAQVDPVEAHSRPRRRRWSVLALLAPTWVACRVASGNWGLWIGQEVIAPDLTPWATSFLKTDEHGPQDRGRMRRTHQPAL